MKLHTLLELGGYARPAFGEDPEICGISADSRTTEPGELFVCIPGHVADGCQFAAEAAQKGAAALAGEIPEELLEIGKELPFVQVPEARKALAALSAAFYGFPSEKLTLWGVTGTNGKTTVSYMIRSICEHGGKACGLLGTISYQVGNLKHKASRTTPEAHTLQKIFAGLFDQGIRHCVMEASSHGLELGRTDFTAFKVGIFTNLTRDHLDFHKTFENYYQAKKKLFRRSMRLCLVNRDDPAGLRLSRELSEDGYPVRTYGLVGQGEDPPDFAGEILFFNDEGTGVLLYQKGFAPEPLYIPIPGIYNVYNGLAAAAACLSEGFSMSQIRRGLQEMGPVPGRFERIDGPLGQRIIVDYAHTPDALARTLDTARSFTKGRLICVFGCGGERDAEKRPVMGQEAGKRADICILTDDNPRREPSLTILRQIEEGIRKTNCAFEKIPDRRAAIARALELWESGDTILVAGRGHETEQIIGTEEISFDDRQVVRELLYND
ncbi:MAG: UDP-N-acetylmuramoyl-L-alanyl-D-glutamate--2,6-diaminopimelate ligase [Firmicutes bacterium]|nr:UDP-N-acetylmuramoyl-L-alanyl-D-glutamate--2,6-diaminopimelate ligase [Bacillota bacterium]